MQAGAEVDAETKAWLINMADVETAVNLDERVSVSDALEELTMKRERNAECTHAERTDHPPV